MSDADERLVLHGSQRHVASLFLFPVAAFAALGWWEWSQDRSRAWIATKRVLRRDADGS